MSVSRDSYFVKPANGDKKAVALYSDGGGSTVIWHISGDRGLSSSGDRFDEYCQQVLNERYVDDPNPG